MLARVEKRFETHKEHHESPLENGLMHYALAQRDGAADLSRKVINVREVGTEEHPKLVRLRQCQPVTVVA